MKALASLFAIFLTAGCSEPRGDAVDRDLIRFVEGFDRDRDGTLSLEEFSKSAPAGYAFSDELIKKAFNSYDADRDGVLSVQDMREARRQSERGGTPPILNNR